MHACTRGSRLLSVGCGIALMLSPRASSGQSRVPKSCDVLGSVSARSVSTTVDQKMLSQLRACGPAAASMLAGSLNEARRSDNQDAVGGFMSITMYVRDAQIFEAALSVASDASATVLSRIYALMYLQRLVQPGVVPVYEEVSAGFDAHGVPKGSCSSRRVAGDSMEDGAPLPNDWRVRIAQLARRVGYDTREPPQVRTAALCVL